MLVGMKEFGGKEAYRFCDIGRTTMHYIQCMVSYGTFKIKVPS